MGCGTSQYEKDQEAAIRRSCDKTQMARLKKKVPPAGTPPRVERRGEDSTIAHPQSVEFRNQLNVAGVPMDTTGDGMVDTVAYDTTGDGKLDGFDTNLDGRRDAYDTTGDGMADAFDTTGDGQMNAFDLTGDGKINVVTGL